MWNAPGLLPSPWLPLPNRPLAGHNQTASSEPNERMKPAEPSLTHAPQGQSWVQAEDPCSELQQISCLPPPLHNLGKTCCHTFFGTGFLLQLFCKPPLFPQPLRTQQDLSFQSPSANHSDIKWHSFHPGPDVASLKHSNNNGISAENRTVRGQRSMNASIFCSGNWKKTGLLKLVYSGTVRKLHLHKQFVVLFKEATTWQSKKPINNVLAIDF